MDRILKAVSAETDREIHFVRRFAQGREGVLLVEDRSCTPPEQLVVKVWPAAAISPDALRRHHRWADELRSCGWPIPVPVLITSANQSTVLLEPLVDGSHPADIPPVVVDEMLRLALATRLRERGATGWRQALLNEVADHSSALLRPNVLKAHPVGSEVLEILQVKLDAVDDRTSDVVHGDFSPGNTLIKDGHIAAVIDWDRARPGDAAFDVAALEFDLAMWGRGVGHKLPQVTAVVEDLADARAVLWYRAYFAAWNLTWAIGSDDEDAVVRAWQQLRARRV